MMRRIGRRLALLLAAWLAMAGLAMADAAPSEPRNEDRQILVLLRLPPEHFRPNADYGEGYGEGMSRSARRRIADHIAQAHGLVLVSDWALPAIGVDCFVMAVPAGKAPQDAVAELSHDPDVAWSEPMRLYHAEGAAAQPNDPLFRAQPAAAEWRLADLHQVVTGRNIRVAVIDSMVEASHPDLIGQVQIAQNFVDGRSQYAELHGTAVAGVIAAKADNGVGIVGVAPEARLMALRACWQEESPSGVSSTVCDSLSLAKALHFAITHDAQIINLSLSGPFDPLLSKLIDAALKRGVTVVAAYDRNLPSGGFPAAQTGVVGVLDESSAPPPHGVLSAPGRDVPTTEPGGRWYLVSGSSYAAAHISGLFALVRQHATGSREPSALVVSWPSGMVDTCATLLRTVRDRDNSCANAREASAFARR